MAYEARLPDGVSLPEGHRIDTGDERYLQLEAVATAHKWSQAAFSDVLGVEARRVAAERARATPPAPSPAPAPARAVPSNWGSLTFQQKMAWSHANPKRG